jgi:hypothetical protein
MVDNARTAGLSASEQQPAKHTVGMQQMAAALSMVTGGIGLTNANVTAIRKLPPPQQVGRVAFNGILCRV